MDNHQITCQDLVDLVAKLRAPEACPWDRKQTLTSITPYILEETHELLAAISKNDWAEICEESGDLLFQICFLAQIAIESGKFNLETVIQQVKSKMIRRHPHVFGDQTVKDIDAVLTNWEEIKSKEANKRNRASILDGVPASLPALSKAAWLQGKAAGVGFDWPEIDEVLAKIEEEITEFRQAQKINSAEATKEEFGDLVFALVNLARRLGIDPENALTLTNEKFYRRFRYIEKRVQEEGLSLGDCDLERMDQWWNEAKTLETNP